MALEDFFEPFFTQDYESVSDGMGGLMKKYTDKERIQAGCSTESSTQAEIAYRAGTKTIYRITVPVGVVLRQGDVLRRVRDNRLYHVTSDSSDRTTPDVAQVRFSYVTAEVIK